MRIFSRKSSRTSRVLSVLLLSLSLAVTLAGLGTAVYLERERDSALPPSPVAAGSPTAAAIVDTAPVPPPVVVARSESRDPMAAAAAIPEPPSIEPLAGADVAVAAPAQNVASLEHHGGTSAPPAVAAPAPQVARLEVTPEPQLRAVTEPQTAPVTAIETREPTTPTDATSPPRYWVEYGVYTNAHAAKRLQQALADQGLETVIVQTHTPTGRHLLRVRSAPELDYGAAKAASENARRALKLSTLVHRGTPAATNAVARAAEKPAASQGYWVQFGAFPHRPQAARLQEQLAQSGIETAVSTMRGTSGRTLYWVRSLNLPDRGSAMAVASRGKDAGNADFLVGQSVARPAVADPDRTENEPATRTARYHAASLPFPAH